MSDFVKDTLSSESAEDINKIVVALSAEAALPSQKAADAKDKALIAEGKKLIVDKTCTDCHQMGETGDLGTAPTLTGYGSHKWLAGMISNPSHEAYYRDTNDRMPAFAVSPDPKKNTLSPKDLDHLVRWLRGDWYEPEVVTPQP